jgi:hypothetical protein
VTLVNRLTLLPDLELQPLKCGGYKTAYSIRLCPALCVSQERWPFAGLEFLRCGITKPRAIFFGNGSQRGVTDATASR